MSFRPKATGSSLGFSRLRGMLGLLLLLAISALALAACGGGSSSSTEPVETTAAPAETAAEETAAAETSEETASGEATGEPIKVGGISTVSGGIPFVEIPKGVHAYFDDLNANGGIQGRPIEYLDFDDKADPSEAAQLSRKLILEDGVVAMAGNTSLTDCQTNEPFYEENDVGVIGLGPNPTCFNSPNWMPINPGPFVGGIVLLEYAFDDLGLESVCVIGQNEAGSIPYWEQIIPDWEQKTGNQLTLLDFSNDPSQNPTPQVVKAKEAGCDGLIIHTVAPNFVAFVKAAKAVGFDGTILCLGSAYDASVPEALGDLAEPGALGPNSKGLFVNSELAPWTTDDPALDEMRTVLDQAGVPLNFWSQSGYLIADTFVQALKSIDGEITRESVYEALKTMEPYVTPLAGSPLVFGPGDAHSPNLSSKMMTINDGQWVVARDEWVTIDPLPAPEQ